MVATHADPTTAWIPGRSPERLLVVTGYFRLKRKGGSGMLGVNTEATYAKAH